MVHCNVLLCDVLTIIIITVMPAPFKMTDTTLWLSLAVAAPVAPVVGSWWWGTTDREMSLNCPTWTMEDGTMLVVFMSIQTIRRWDNVLNIIFVWWVTGNFVLQVLLVTGGYGGRDYLSSTEILVNGSEKWEVVANLPTPVRALREDFQNSILQILSKETKISILIN